MRLRKGGRARGKREGAKGERGRVWVGGRRGKGGGE